MILTNVADSLLAPKINNSKYIATAYFANTSRKAYIFESITGYIYEKNKLESMLYNAGVYINKLEAFTPKAQRKQEKKILQNDEIEDLKILEKYPEEFELNIPIQDSIFTLKRTKNNVGGKYYVFPQKINTKSKTSLHINSNYKKNLYLFFFKESDCSNHDFEKSINKILRTTQKNNQKIKYKTIYRDYNTNLNQFRIISLLFFVIFSIFTYIIPKSKPIIIAIGLFLTNSLLFLMAFQFFGAGKSTILLNTYVLINLLILLFIIFTTLHYINKEKYRITKEYSLFVFIFCLVLVIPLIILLIFALNYNNIRNKLHETFYREYFMIENRSIEGIRISKYSNEEDTQKSFIPEIRESLGDIFYSSSSIVISIPKIFTINLFYKPELYQEASGYTKFDGIDHIKLDLISDQYSLLDSLSRVLKESLSNDRSIFLNSQTIISDHYMKVSPYYQKLYGELDTDFLFLPKIPIQYTNRGQFRILKKDYYYPRYENFTIKENVADTAMTCVEINNTIYFSRESKPLPVTLTDLEQLPYTLLYHSKEGIKKKDCKLKDVARVDFAGELVKYKGCELGSIQNYFHINQKRAVRHIIYLNPFMSKKDNQRIKDKLNHFVEKHSKYITIKIKY